MGQARLGVGHTSSDAARAAIWRARPTAPATQPGGTGLPAIGFTGEQAADVVSSQLEVSILGS